MKPKNILIIGDSFVEGVGAPSEKGWAYLLADKFPDHKFSISGLGGDTTEKILVRMPSDFYDYFFFQVGTNDSRYRPSKKGTEIAEKKFKKNLKKILSGIKGESKAFFVGLLFVDERKTSPYKEDKVYSNVTLRRYDNLIKEFCESNEKAEYISLQEMLDNEDYLWDGVHPSERGHKEIATIVSSALRKTLKGK